MKLHEIYDKIFIDYSKIGRDGEDKEHYWRIRWRLKRDYLHIFVIICYNSLLFLEIDGLWECMGYVIWLEIEDYLFGRYEDDLTSILFFIDLFDLQDGNTFNTSMFL